MGFLRWVIRVLIVLFLIRMAVMLVRGFLSGRSRRMSPRPSGRPTERLGGRLVRDPHCGTHVPLEKAVVHGRGAASHYFCSTTCRDAWLASAAEPPESRGNL